ncbi:hypothetical protein M409DRAFT_23015 [Zasmidium cellare ATCC 36951]|uniref:Uncharacterized protein n=1 Tax=Zasmidium cellare ATCC 36951 TaxID=1080233 RepID=A0A6A6CLE3_ZASCE|nr:uncharacterized protein M409DRAFT_23015 [Zasmidium cellare ATCC 36951]KAF2166970.1 hypothetical protein M409DRAFT_23015 [Zasmidium cellare ATCC 36951]
MPLDKILGHALSFAAEYQQQRRLKRVQSGENSDARGDSLEAALFEDDEQDWELDEAIQDKGDHHPPYEKSLQTATTDQLIRDTFSSRVPETCSTSARPANSLRHPIVIPQRRPGNKKRGFVRAYAPVLDDCGISQETFLRFLKNFHQSSQASPWFGVIQVSAAIAGFAPSAVAVAVCMAIQAGAKAGAEIQHRHRTNDFLEKMNEEFFKPAGLFAMIMTYKPDSSISSLSQNSSLVSMSTRYMNLKANDAMTELEDNSGNLGNLTRKLKISSGTTRGEVELPEFAPLIFPDVDAAVQRGEEETFKNNVKGFRKFFAAYMDRQAHMNFARENPDSGLNVPESYRQLSSDSFLGRAGQAVRSSQGKDAFIRSVMGTTSSESRTEMSIGEPLKERLLGQKGDSNSGKPGCLGIKRMLKEDILYLTIVSLPNENEMASARRELNM